MDKIRQYEGSRKKHNLNRWIYSSTRINYDFSATFILSDFIYIYFHTVFSEKQISNTFLHNIYDSKRSIHMKTYLLRILNKREVLSRFFGKSNIFKYIFSRARHVLMTF